MLDEYSYTDELESVFEHYANSFTYRCSLKSERTWVSKKLMFCELGQGALTTYEFLPNFPKNLDSHFFSGDFRSELERAFEQIAAMLRGRKLVIAYSGGIDSEVLLHLAVKMGLEPCPIFVDVWGINSDELYWANKYTGEMGLSLVKIKLSYEEYLESWRHQEATVSENFSPGAFSAFILSKLDPSRHVVMFGSGLPQVAWNKTQKKFYHICRETDRTERQKLAKKYGITCVYPFQFGRVWYTIAHSLLQNAMSHCIHRFQSEVPGQEFLFFRGDIESSATQMQKSLLYKNFPELSRRPKMTAHNRIQFCRDPVQIERRAKQMVAGWLGIPWCEFEKVRMRSRHAVMPSYGNVEDSSQLGYKSEQSILCSID